MSSQTLTTPVIAPAATIPLPQRDLVSIRDLSPNEVESLFHLSARLKARPEDFRTALSGKHVAMFFEKTSLRTRLTFEVGIRSLGGSSLFVDQRGEKIGQRESLPDVAHNLERWMDGIVLRTNDRMLKLAHQLGFSRDADPEDRDTVRVALPL